MSTPLHISYIYFVSHSNYSNFPNQPLSTQTFHKDKRGQGESFEEENDWLKNDSYFEKKIEKKSLAHLIKTKFTVAIYILIYMDNTKNNLLVP